MHNIVVRLLHFGELIISTYTYFTHVVFYVTRKCGGALHENLRYVLQILFYVGTVTDLHLEIRVLPSFSKVNPNMSWVASNALKQKPALHDSVSRVYNSEQKLSVTITD